MLALRLARGAHPLVLLRRLLVAAASAGVGFLLLTTLTYASSHPAHAPQALLRLLWSLIPMAATVYFAVSVARTDPSTRPSPGLSAAGLGPVSLTALAAVSTAVSCTLGSVLALLFFLHLRGDITGLPFDGAASRLLASEAPLPLAAALTLLALTPVLAAAGSAWTLRPRKASGAPLTAPTGLPWGIALIAAGLATESYTSRAAAGTPFPLPGHFDGSPLGVLAGWTLTAFGLATAGPGLTYAAGRALQSVRPGAVRLLAGRVLQAEARRIGRPLGVVCAVTSGVIAAATVYAPGPHSFGPLTGLGAAVVVICAVATLLMAALESKQARSVTTTALLKLGAPAQLLRTATALRAAALLAVFAPLTWAVAALAALPLTG
ncbi:hypothetical protein [Streptomyces beijiangensis]|uniref:Uncharacterized protein n=1 Tax=Streptomyces beijiangensis TaxID=163361 RepID=A0A939FBH1_9ACTN|nr:hypothetical protein [Streptomyces beijiangensis]MBO0515018.1 hypothetical protein [Streptomyces beijiangensis]